MIVSPWTRRLAALLVVLLALGTPRPAQAYLKFGFDVGGETRTLKWKTLPIAYYVNNQGIPGVSATDFQAAIQRAFMTWQDVPTSTVAYRFAGYTSSLPGDDDGISTLGFLSEPALDRVLASTSFLVDDLTGELLESDIFFNAAFAWSAGATGVASKWDLQTIAVHEIGHFNGLGHSAIGETEPSGTGRRVLSTGAVMFPIALGLGDISSRTLMPDDIAGVSDLYPADGFTSSTGSLSGRVEKNGVAVFGAHVVAIDLKTGSQVGNFSLDSQGRFSIGGLRPGPHLLRVEPLDDADVESFFGGANVIDIDFSPRFHDRIVAVPRGGDSGQVVVKVTRR